MQSVIGFITYKPARFGVYRQHQSFSITHQDFGEGDDLAAVTSERTNTVIVVAASTLLMPLAKRKVKILNG